MCILIPEVSFYLMLLINFDTYILKAFMGPFMVTFFITLFILLMQFLWKYIDDLVGKGLEWYLVAELIFYASASFVPLALPLAVWRKSRMVQISNLIRRTA